MRMCTLNPSAYVDVYTEFGGLPYVRVGEVATAPHGPYPLIGRRWGGGHCRAGYRGAGCGCWAACPVALALLFAVAVFAL